MIRLFRVFIPISTLTLLVAEILLTNLSFLAASYALWDVDPTDYLFYDGGVVGIVVVSSIFVLGLYFSGLYSGVYVKSKILILYQLFLVTGLTFLFEGLISSASAQLRLPIRVMLFGSCLSVLAVYAWRLFFSRYASGILGSAGVLLVGSDPVVEALGCYIDSHAQSGLRVTGCVLEEGAHDGWFPWAPHLGYTANLPEIVLATQPNRIVVGTSLAATAEFARVLEDLRFAGQNVQEAAETYETVCGRVWVRSIPPADLIYASRFGPPLRHVLVQRFLLPILGLAALILLAPAMAVIWLVLRVRSTGPVLVGETRVGLDNRVFTRYRFRLDTPSDNASRGAAGTIAKFHLDGLPQLFNVCRGDMAFVGPRPERAEFVNELSELIPYYPQRHCVRPGITGWAQIQDGPPVEETLAKLEYDLYYIKNMSMSLDAVILFQTLRSIFLASPSDESTGSPRI